MFRMQFDMLCPACMFAFSSRTAVSSTLYILGAWGPIFAGCTMSTSIPDDSMPSVDADSLTARLVGHDAAASIRERLNKHLLHVAATCLNSTHSPPSARTPASSASRASWASEVCCEKHIPHVNACISNFLATHILTGVTTSKARSLQ